MAELYKKLGGTEFQAWYQTLVEAGEYDQLGDVVSGMIAEKQAKQGGQPPATESKDFVNESDVEGDAERNRANQSKG